MYEIQHHFPFDVSPTRDGKVTLTLEIEAIHVKTFLQMLESLSSFFRVVNQKARVALAYSRSDQTHHANMKYYDEYFVAVVDCFKRLRKETAHATKDLISVTLREIKETYPNSSYDSVKQILTKSGELKKNGFYGKKV